MKSASAQTYTFEADRGLLYHTIMRQAGTLDKAITEGVMNAIEAGATRVNITVDIPLGREDNSFCGTVVIEDDGQGFVNEEHIQVAFRRFGAPHSETEKKQKVWAEFRMGRGQMFAFGRNTWRSNEFELQVDVANEGLSFKQIRHAKSRPGCEIRIELYNNQLNTYVTQASLIASLAKAVEFVAIPVFVNGERVTRDVSEIKWSYVTDDAYFMFGISRAVSMYNLGVFVRDYHMSDFGIDCIVVSRKQLIMNMARNDVQSSCPVFKRICDVIRAEAKKLTSSIRRAETLSDEARIALLKRLQSGEERWFTLRCRPLWDPCHKFIDHRLFFRSQLPWTIAPEGDPMGDELSISGEAIVISEDVLSSLRYTGQHKNFLTWLKLHEHATIDSAQLVARYRTLSELSNGRSVSRDVLPMSEWSSAQRAAINALTAFGLEGRRALIAKHDARQSNIRAWTDGRTYIAFSPWVLPRANASLRQINDLLGLITHELAHDDDTTTHHHHGPAFYQRYYELDRSLRLRIDHLKDCIDKAYSDLSTGKLQRKLDREQRIREKRAAKLTAKTKTKPKAGGKARAKAPTTAKAETGVKAVAASA